MTKQNEDLPYDELERSSGFRDLDEAKRYANSHDLEISSVCHPTMKNHVPINHIRIENSELNHSIDVLEAELRKSEDRCNDILEALTRKVTELERDKAGERLRVLYTLKGQHHVLCDMIRDSGISVPRKISALSKNWSKQIESERRKLKDLGTGEEKG